ncbi:hypothetical protein OG948_02985 [Embleya sp. NBC_00888]|uniref:hypothetical protein n=1 Tax=Embleya sp. NBC_00888 TaxID=2975960 RepID=UPI003870DDBB|nr:hypothetical protein OG948_02985 [Embleya sp. NBC_00888]
MVEELKDAPLAKRITAMRRARDAEAKAPVRMKIARPRIRTVRRHSWTRGTGVRAVIVPKRAPLADDAWPVVDIAWRERTLPTLLDDAGLPFYRRHQVLYDYPDVAARVVRMQLAADLEALRQGYATARLWCRDAGLPPHATEELLALYATLGTTQHQIIDRAEALLRERSRSEHQDR